MNPAMKQLFDTLDIDLEVHTPDDIVKRVNRQAALRRQSEGRREENRKHLLRQNEELVRSLYYDGTQSDDPADILGAEEELAGKVKELSPLLRATLDQHYLEGKSVEEIAKEEGSDPKAIYERLRLARNTLKGEIYE